MDQFLWMFSGGVIAVVGMFIAIACGWIGRIDPVSPAERQALRDSRRVLREANQTYYQAGKL